MWVAATWAFISVTAARISVFSTPLSGLGNRIFLTWIVLIPATILMLPGPLPLAFSAVTLFILKPTDRSERVAYFVGVFPAIADFSAYQIPFPGIQFLINMTFFKVAVLVLLLPVALSYAKQARNERTNWILIDTFVVGYAVYLALMTLRDASISHTLRILVDQLILIVIPYYALSRFITTKEMLTKTLWGFFFMAAITAWIALIATVVQWQFYQIHNVSGGFLSRNELLRISTTMNTASVCTAMVGGYVIAEYFRARSLFTSLHVWGFRLLFVIAILVTGNRGGILQFAVAVLLLYGLKKLSSGTRRVVLTCGLVGFVVLVTSWSTIDWGLVDSTGSTFEFRADLLEVSVPQFFDYPLFGQVDFEQSEHFDSVVQRYTQPGGGRFIDVTNWYLQILLGFGLTGLVLFVVPYFKTTSWLYRRFSTFDSSREEQLLFASIFSLLVSFLVVIMTTSAMSLIPAFAIIFLSLGRALMSLQHSSG